MVDTEKSTRILTRALTWFLLAHRAQLQKGEPRMHGQHHDGAQQYEQGVGALFDLIHSSSPAA
jgi:hypothetical protein